MSDFIIENAKIKSLSGDIKITDASCKDSNINTESERAKTVYLS